MGHPASGGAQGDVDRMVSMNKMIQRFVNKMEADVSAKMGISFYQYKYMTGTELWVDAEDSLDLKLSDELANILIEVSPIQSDTEDRSRNGKRSTVPDFQWITKGFEYLYGDY
jgi:ATP-dependent protease ClpP protease subunit